MLFVYHLHLPTSPALYAHTHTHMYIHTSFPMCLFVNRACKQNLAMLFGIFEIIDRRVYTCFCLSVCCITLSNPPPPN